MQIQKVNYQRTKCFGESIVIRSAGSARLLNSLETVNIDKWSQKVNPKLSYAYLHQDKEGFHCGLLANGDEAKSMKDLYALHRDAIQTKGAFDMSLVERIVGFNNNLASKSSQVTVESLRDLLALPMLANAGRRTQRAIIMASRSFK